VLWFRWRLSKEFLSDGPLPLVSRSIPTISDRHNPRIVPQKGWRLRFSKTCRCLSTINWLVWTPKCPITP
jgi:hypothetical protein